MTKQIASFSILYDNPQIDGRRQVCERHIDSDGNYHDYHYVAEEGEDVQPKMLAHVLELNALFVWQEDNIDEMRQNLVDDMQDHIEQATAERQAIMDGAPIVLSQGGDTKIDGPVLVDEPAEPVVAQPIKGGG